MLACFRCWKRHFYPINKAVLSQYRDNEWCLMIKSVPDRLSVVTSVQGDHSNTATLGQLTSASRHWDLLGMEGRRHLPFITSTCDTWFAGGMSAHISAVMTTTFPAQCHISSSGDRVALRVLIVFLSIIRLFNAITDSHGLGVI